MKAATGRRMRELPILLDEAGLSDPVTLPEAVARMPFRSLQILLSQISEVLLSPTQPAVVETTVPNLGFDFLASSSARGDSFCRACARDKIRSLARYAALYCDRVLIPFPGLDPTQHDSQESRERIAERLFFLYELRPVLEADIVQLFRPFHFCKEHRDAHAAVTAPVRAKAEKIYRDRLKEFDVVYRPKRRYWGQL